MLNASKGAEASNRKISGFGFSASRSRFLLWLRADGGMIFSKSVGDCSEGAGGLTKEFISRSPSVLRVGVDVKLPGRGVNVLVEFPGFCVSDFITGSSATTTESCLEIVAGLRWTRRGRRLAGSPRDRSGTMDVDKNGSRVKAESAAASFQIEAERSGDDGLCVLVIRIGEEDFVEAIGTSIEGTV